MQMCYTSPMNLLINQIGLDQWNLLYFIVIFFANVYYLYVLKNEKQ